MNDIRQAVISDLQAILSIEKLAGFSHWTESQLKLSIERDIVMVVEQQQKVVAFAIFSQVIDEAELLNIAVMPIYQGKGIAMRLIQAALRQIFEQQVTKCFLEVAVSNLRAIRLYEKLGFRQISVRKNYYPAVNGSEDALIMQLALTENLG